MKVILIVAVCEKNLGIGKNNDLLWHLPADMIFFKNTTKGFPIITGRKNYESIPLKFRPLPGRENIIVSRNSQYLAPKADVVSSIQEAIELAEKTKKDKCYIIGGGQIYKAVQEANLVHELLITWVKTDCEADTYFEGFNANNWTSSIVLEHEKDESNKFDFKIVKYTPKLAV